MVDFVNGSMNAMRAFFCGALVAALVGLLSPSDALAQQFPPLDHRLLFDPSALDQNPGVAGAGASASGAQAQAARRSGEPKWRSWSATAYIFPGDFGPTGAEHDWILGAARAGSDNAAPAPRTPALMSRPTPGAFSVDIATERAATTNAWLTDDTTVQEAPFGQKPRRRFVPFIGLSAKSPLY
jgi:hypothetical protein